MADKLVQLWASDGTPILLGFDDIGAGEYAVKTSQASSAGGTASPPANGDFTERSTTITAGGTAQVAMSANASRKAWFFQNIGTADLWISFVETAQADNPGSVKVAPGASAFSSGGFVSAQALSVVGATTGQKFTLWEA